VYAFRIGAPGKNHVAILFEDITARWRDEERAALVHREIEHRARNLFAMFEGMIRLTRADTVDAFRAALLRRVRHSLTSTTCIESTGPVSELSALVQHVLAPYQPTSGRLILSGPAVALDEAVSQCLSMILHELATNSVKYGSLTVPGGSVTLSWQLDGGTLQLRWKESDGPPVEPPTRDGFGSRVIERCVRDQLGGEISRHWHRSGVEYEVAVPLRRSPIPDRDPTLRG
jgi:two-component sensor histidine kinase